MKAIVLISGGLDSLLAVKAMQNQGIKVLAMNFLIPFLKNDLVSSHNFFAKRIAEQLDCEYKIITLGEDYLEMMKNPRYGYGKNFNPCIDCKILMLKKAKNLMSEVGASFIATGEVLGQRPMSQHKQALKSIEEASGLGGLLVRPLSALILPMTIPQEKGWLNKELLFDITGRGRGRQISLAKKWGIEEYPWPGGGCLLTDPHFCRRLKDLLKHDQLSIENIELLKVGRHFRITPEFKIIVGRDRGENDKLVSLANSEDLLFEPSKLPGPTGVGRGISSKGLKDIAAKIIARYTSLDEEVEIVYGNVSQKDKKTILVKGIDEKQFKEWLL